MVSPSGLRRSPVIAASVAEPRPPEPSPPALWDSSPCSEPAGAAELVKTGGVVPATSLASSPLLQATMPNRATAARGATTRVRGATRLRFQLAMVKVS